MYHFKADTNNTIAEKENLKPKIKQLPQSENTEFITQTTNLSNVNIDGINKTGTYLYFLTQEYICNIFMDII